MPTVALFPSYPHIQNLYNSMGLIIIFITLFQIGALRSALLSVCGIPGSYIASTVSILVAQSYCGLALLFFNQFTPANYLASIIILSAPIVIYLNKSRLDRIKASKASRLSPSELIGIVVIFTLGAIIRLPASNYLFGGQDPGVYANLGNYFASHGTHIVKDPILPLLTTRVELKEQYLKATYHGIGQKKDGRWHGTYVPGLYVRSNPDIELIPQFYHLHPLWLAVGNWVFGMEYAASILGLFSLLTVSLVGLLTFEITRCRISGFSAAYLAAINPAHSYFATFPVSETVASFFFLSGLYFFIVALSPQLGSRRKSSFCLAISALAFGALFLTRITGFVTIPLILISITLILIRHRLRLQYMLFGFGFGCLALFILSYYWGISQSGTYARTIYRGKLGIFPHILWTAPWFFLSGAILWSSISFFVIRIRIGATCAPLIRRHLGLIILILIISAVSYRGYLLAFTDTYLSHRWFGKRWHIAGNGFLSLRKMSIAALISFLSVPGFIAFLFGFTQLWRRALVASRFIPLAIFTAGFFAILTIKQITAPYLYYFSRYLVSELLPLSIVSSCFGAYIVISKFSRTRRQCYLFAWIIFVVACTLPHIHPTLGRLSAKEGNEYSEALRCVSEVVGDKGIILLDKRNFAETPFKTPMLLSFNRPIFALSAKMAESPERLKEIGTFFNSIGFEPIIITSGAKWGEMPGTRRELALNAVWRYLSASKEHLLPFRYKASRLPIQLYKFDDFSPRTHNPLPEVCQSVAATR
jgi:hypothetical protein